MSVLREERIGGQRLILGDCLGVIISIGMVDHIFCDPPYEDIMHNAKSSGSRTMRADGGGELKSLDFEGIDSIRDDFVRISSEVCRGWFISFCAPEGVGRWADAINNSSMKYKRACIWVKPDSAPQFNGQGPAMGAECFVSAWAGKGYSRWNAGGKRGVYTHIVNPPDRHGCHPTEKPWRLMSELLRDFTNEGEVILDPFMGSGTTLVAAQKMGRAAIGIERDPKYFEIACERVAKAAQQPSLFEPAEVLKQSVLNLGAS